MILAYNDFKTAEMLAKQASKFNVNFESAALHNPGHDVYVVHQSGKMTPLPPHLTRQDCFIQTIYMNSVPCYGKLYWNR